MGFDEYLLRCDRTTLLGCLIFDVAKKDQKSDGLNFFVDTSRRMYWPGHMPVPMVETLNEMQLRFRVHMCVG